MSKRSKVFLFGAGAILPWGAPKTSDLTELVLKSGFKIRGGEITITQFIYNKLIQNNHSSEYVNFETIINVIEEFISYYSYSNNLNRTSSLLSCFFSSDFEQELLNFSVSGGEPKHNYKLQIPEGVDYDFSNYLQHNETPPQFFFQHLLAEILTDINVCIEKYANHCINSSSIDKESKVSKSYINWMLNLKNKWNLRIYTLNYDRVFKVLLENSGVSVFEGFDCGEVINYGVSLRANVPKILSDFETNVYYNLHGSAFWKVEALDTEQLPNPEFFLTSNVTLPLNYRFANFQLEKGKNLMLTNIVTGHQKGQKTHITPLKQMQSAFDKDCCFADEIFIIGYSFGDEHINESIKTAIRHNNDVKITIVDPYFTKNNRDVETAMKLFPFKSDAYANSRPTTIQKNLHIFFDGAITVHAIGFEEFLDCVKNPLYKTSYYNRSKII
ncbi:MAG TPA: SIR2 family protein [Chitinophagaceae bacterium]|nr:SIR2 family protein [Chitinophagaceae bacterium]